MKRIILSAITCLLFVACTKEQNTRIGWQPLNPIMPIKPIPIRPLYRLSICINSYQELTTWLGEGIQEVTGVILENGTTIVLDKMVQSILYKAQEASDNNSLFRSHLMVSFDRGGYLQTYTSDVWSLGCVYQDSGQPPFTNIIKGYLLLEVNTCFIWNVPPYDQDGIRVKFIIIP